MTVEGYRTAGRSHVYGIVDSLHYPGTSSFLRYQYPSQLPEEVRRRLATLSERVIDQIGLDQMTFNIEYFRDPETDRVRLLEVNPRHSQSHALLFERVDGVSNHELLVQRRAPPAAAGHQLRAGRPGVAGTGTAAVGVRLGVRGATRYIRTRLG